MCNLVLISIKQEAAGRKRLQLMTHITNTCPAISHLMGFSGKFSPAGAFCSGSRPPSCGGGGDNECRGEGLTTGVAPGAPLPPLGTSRPQLIIGN